MISRAVFIAYSG